MTKQDETPSEQAAREKAEAVGAPPQIRRVPGATLDKIGWIGPKHREPMTLEQMRSPVWINLPEDGHGFIYQDHESPDEYWDLQPSANPHQVMYYVALRLVQRGRARLATEEQVNAAGAARRKDPRWQGHPGRSRKWVEPVRPIDDEDQIAHLHRTGETRL